jgi:hypothetical protein
MKYQWLKLSAVAAILISPLALAEEQESQDFKIGFGYDVGLSVMAQYKENINLAIGDGGLAVDYLFKNGQFSGDVPFTWYIGGGGWIGWNDQFGARLPVGLDWNFASKWDAFAHLAPGINYNTNSSDFDLDIGAAIGVRYQF